jgi:transcriptional regulator with XRE-family HTH domain
LGERIRALRQQQGMTLEDLAGLANISASHLSRLERGQTQPSFIVAATLADHLGVSLSQLLADGDG